MIATENPLGKETKKIKSVTFRPHGKGETILQTWDEMGYDRSVLMNTLLSKYGEQAIKDLPALLEQIGVTPTFTQERPEQTEMKLDICAVSSVVEHILHTDGVAGSKPAPRTILKINFRGDVTPEACKKSIVRSSQRTPSVHAGNIRAESGVRVPGANNGGQHQGCEQSAAGGGLRQWKR